MQVRITNVTDGPGKKPVEVRVYNKRLRPGAFMDVPVQFIDDKVRRLEQTGTIIIGKLPPWYSDFEAKRKVRNLTADEITENVKHKKAMRDSEMKEVLQAEISQEVVLEVSALPSSEEYRKRNTIKR